MYVYTFKLLGVDRHGNSVVWPAELIEAIGSSPGILITIQENYNGSKIAANYNQRWQFQHGTIR